MTIRFADELRKKNVMLRDERGSLHEQSKKLLARMDTPGTDTTGVDDEIDKIVARSEAIKDELFANEARIAELDALEAERNAAPKSAFTSHGSPIGDNAGPTIWRQTPAWAVDARAVSDSEAITHARAALEATQARSIGVPDQGLAKVADVLTSGIGSEPARMARWAVATSNPAYERAFAKMLRDPVRGHLEWSEAERAAYNAVTDISRAMSLTDANGGYMVPFSLDPSIMLTNNGSNNPLRRLATVKLTTTDSWNGITSAGATSEWKAEGAQVADGSPTLAQPSIPTFFGDSFVPYSFEFGMDAVDALGELGRILVDSADNLMSAAYTTGDGVNAPQGIITGLAGTASEINTTGSEALDDSDPFVLQNALAARFSANAVFQSHIAIANAYRQMETTNGALLFPELRETPASLLGKPWVENSNMDGSINPAVTANNYALLYGDVAAGFFIVDRIGATLELIPNLMGANNRPTGQRGALLWFRTGSKVVVPQALRLLDVPTTA
jgi:HK97 family phage major capsid protein